jgi:hypothetical protein
MVYENSLNNQIPVLAANPFLCPAQEIDHYVGSLKQYFPDCRISTYRVTSVIDLGKLDPNDYWVFESETFDNLMQHLTQLEHYHPSGETRAQVSGIINRLQTGRLK